VAGQLRASVAGGPNGRVGTQLRLDSGLSNTMRGASPAALAPGCQVPFWRLPRRRSHGMGTTTTSAGVRPYCAPCLP